MTPLGITVLAVGGSVLLAALGFLAVVIVEEIRGEHPGDES